MVEGLIPDRVFISYSHEDKGMAERIRGDLEVAGIVTWMDRELIPGTPNWEVAIRNAILQCYAVVLIASPHSRQTPYVQGELSLAKSKARAVIPVWVTGDEWIESISLSMVYTHYIDCRAANYAAGLQELLKTLQEIADARLPRHCLLTKKYMDEYKAVYGYLPLNHKGYLTIALSDSEDLVAMRYGSYHSLQALLDDLYMGYLKDQYEPYTYGTQWMIGRGLWSDFIEAILPAAWLCMPENQVLGSFCPEWFAAPLEDKEEYHYELLQVCSMKHGSIFGLATNHLGAVEALESGKPGKVVRERFLAAIHGGRRNASGYFMPGFRLVKSEEVQKSAYKYFVMLVSHEASFRKAHKATFIDADSHR